MDDCAGLLRLNTVSQHNLPLHRGEHIAWYCLEPSILSAWLAILLPLLRLSANVLPYP